MRALVTGGSGFVGQHLIRHLVACSDSVTATFQSSERHWSLPQIPSVAWQELNIADAALFRSFLRDNSFDVVYHLAGMAFVPEAEEHFDRALAVNVGGTHTLFDTVSRKKSPPRVIVVSSAEVYGAISPEHLPLREDAPCRPANNYSLTKRMAELVVERYGTVSSAVMRPFNHIGPQQNERFVAPNFALQLARIAAGRSEPTLKVGNLDARRDFTDVRDIVRAYRLAAVWLENNQRGLFNLGSGSARPVQEILDTLISVSGVKVTKMPNPERMRPSEVPEVWADISRARSLLKWSPEYSLIDTLTDVYRCAQERITAEG
jgi:GDP-4-dehydro-6-deoxy-D-mannose reductase